MPELTQDTARRVRYLAALRRLDVQHNPRYRANREGANETYCNLFVADATAMMGAPIPLFVLDGEGQKRWLDVDGMLAWLRAHAEQWRVVSAAEAQQEANRGWSVVAAWHNPHGHGHMAMVRPGPEPLGARGPRIAHAGAQNAADTDAATGFGGDTRLSEIVYFAPSTAGEHASNGDINSMSRPGPAPGPAHDNDELGPGQGRTT